MIYSRAKKHEISSLLKNVRSIPMKEEMLNMPIDTLDLSVRATNALAKAEIKTISDFIFLGPEKLYRVSNAGEKTICEIEKTIKQVLITDNCGDRKEMLHEHKNDECFKTEESNLTFEERIKNSFDKNLLSTSMEELNLTVRALNGLKNSGLKTIKDVVDFGFNTLRTKKNIGRKTITDIKDAILGVQKTQMDKISEISFVDAICSIISSVTPKYLPIIEARFGYDGKCKTLEEIGRTMGITRERVRQVIVRESRLIRHSGRNKEMQALLENIERLLFRYKGILSINDISKDNYFIYGTQKQRRFLTNLLKELYEDRYRIVDKYFLTSLNDNGIKIFQSNIREAALKCKFPIDEKALLDNIQSSVGLISKDYLSYHLLYREHIEVSQGQVLSLGRLSIPQRVKIVMKDIDMPMHFTEIAMFYKDRIGGKKVKTKDFARAIHTRIGDSKDFIIVGPGTFITREKFEIPNNIEEIVKTSKEILLRLKDISDTKYLISKLKKQGIDVGNLNEYSLKPILLEYPGFIKYRKFEIGIEELTDRYERRSLSDLIYEVLSAISKPMHVKSIWKEIQTKRGFPKYTIDQRLTDNPRFIRIAPATYTVPKNISHYEEKRKSIIDFAKEWIQLKGNPISSFFVREVLKETKEIKDLSLGLVEHILATSPEFIRLPNGFYDLAGQKK